MPLFIRHYNDERIEDLDQRDLAETNGDEDHISDCGIYGYTETVDPALDRVETNYQFAVEEMVNWQTTFMLVSMDDWAYILTPDDPDAAQPVIKQTVDEQIDLLVKAEAILRHAAEDNMGLAGHARHYKVLIPDRVITCYDPITEKRVSKSYYDPIRSNGDIKWVSLPTVIKYRRDRSGHLIEIR